jgi:HSP20 family molecular chaperone IbpA
MAEYHGRGMGERYDAWRFGDPPATAYGAYGYGEDPAPGRYGFASYGEYVRPFERDRFYAEGGEALRSGEHLWRGGVLGWLGAGVRVGAAWFGERLQRWGSRLGGKLTGGGAGLGRALRGRGEQVGTALEERGEQAMQGYRGRYGVGPLGGRPPRSYRRPDDRILDDVQQRVAMAGVDADEVEIEAANGVVTLSGRVPRRFEKRIVEEIAEQVFGVEEVRNHIRLARAAGEAEPSTPTPTGLTPGDGPH